jgi:hypothetical protein
MLHKKVTKQYFDLLRTWKTDGILWRGINMYSGQNCYIEGGNIKIFRMLLFIKLLVCE